MNCCDNPNLTSFDIVEASVEVDDDGEPSGHTDVDWDTQQSIGDYCQNCCIVIVPRGSITIAGHLFVNLGSIEPVLTNQLATFVQIWMDAPAQSETARAAEADARRALRYCGDARAKEVAAEATSAVRDLIHKLIQEELENA